MNTKFWQRPQTLIWAVLLLIPAQVVFFVQVRNMGAKALQKAMDGEPASLSVAFVAADKFTYLFFGTAVLDIALLLAAAALIAKTPSR